MANDPDFAACVCERPDGPGAVRSRKMFGSHMACLNDKPVVITCDNRATVKTLPCLAGPRRTGAHRKRAS